MTRNDDPIFGSEAQDEVKRQAKVIAALRRELHESESRNEILWRIVQERESPARRWYPLAVKLMDEGNRAIREAWARFDQINELTKGGRFHQGKVPLIAELAEKGMAACKEMPAPENLFPEGS